VEVPEVHYARGSDLAIAYQVLGEGPVDLVFAPFLTSMSHVWELEPMRGFLQRLSTFSRLILFDKRGTGLSDQPRDIPTLEARMDDVRAVMDAVGSRRAVLFGVADGGQACAMFAATYPERTARLILWNVSAKRIRTDEYEAGLTVEGWHARLLEIRERWGDRDFHEELGRLLNPSVGDDPTYLEWVVRTHRAAASPGAAYASFRMLMETDLSDILPAVRVPTLVMHSPAERVASTYLAGLISGAMRIEVPGLDSSPGLHPEVADEAERFVAGELPAEVPETVLATVMFTDIAGSTKTAAAVGDRAWRDLLARHHSLVRRELGRYRGVEVDNAGDGFFATFDGPARAIACARAVVAGAGELGLQVRAGIHTGECELHDGKVAGIAVHLGARVAAAANPGQVLATSTVKDLVAGSDLDFSERGEHELKGVPGRWRLYAVA
jgi:class 3 adenylate cyclase